MTQRHWLPEPRRVVPFLPHPKLATPFAAGGSARNVCPSRTGLTTCAQLSTAAATLAVPRLASAPAVRLEKRLDRSHVRSAVHPSMLSSTEREARSSRPNRSASQDLQRDAGHQKSTTSQRLLTCSTKSCMSLAGAVTGSRSPNTVTSNGRIRSSNRGPKRPRSLHPLRSRSGSS